MFLNKKKYDIIGFFLISILTVSIYLYGSFKVKVINNLKATTLPVEIKILSTKIPIERFYLNVDVEETLIKLVELSSPKKK